MAETNPESSQHVLDSWIREQISGHSAEPNPTNGSAQMSSQHPGPSACHSTSLDDLRRLVENSTVSVPDDPLQRFLRPDETSDPWVFERLGFNSFVQTPASATDSHQAEAKGNERENSTGQN
ncbi:hypothetical protein VTN49DRAFT_5993 [Thermomyces lanuginosus]|uniref:uncharacterized protein n=1 Tax=Thermomyces lanuginosus TaxID=5541 RepID=UPI003743C5FC